MLVQNYHSNAVRHGGSSELQGSLSPISHAETAAYVVIKSKPNTAWAAALMGVSKKGATRCGFQHIFKMVWNLVLLYCKREGVLFSGHMVVAQAFSLASIIM